jgi:WD40 repeat protein
LWDVTTGKVLRRLTDHSASALEAIFSPDGRLVVSGSADQTLIVWDIETGVILRRFTNLRSGIYKADFNPDGDRFWWGILMAQSNSGKLIWTPISLPGQIFTVMFLSLPANSVNCTAFNLLVMKV